MFIFVSLINSIMQTIQLHDKKFKTYITSDKILEAVKVVAQKISTDLENKKPLFLVVLNGSFMFASDLLREVNILSEISFIKVASYHGTSSSGSVTELIGLSEEIKGRNVVIIEDIVDTGVTLEKLVAVLEKKGVNDIKVASFLMKPDSYKKDIKVDYVGMEIPNDFVVGYGLDYDGLGRNLKDIYVLAQ